MPKAKGKNWKTLDVVVGQTDEHLKNGRAFLPSGPNERSNRSGFGGGRGGRRQFSNNNNDRNDRGSNEPSVADQSSDWRRDKKTVPRSVPNARTDRDRDRYNSSSNSGSRYGDRDRDRNSGNFRSNNRSENSSDRGGFGRDRQSNRNNDNSGGSSFRSNKFSNANEEPEQRTDWRTNRTRVAITSNNTGPSWNSQRTQPRSDSSSGFGGSRFGGGGNRGGRDPNSSSGASKFSGKFSGSSTGFHNRGANGSTGPELTTQRVTYPKSKRFSNLSSETADETRSESKVQTTKLSQRSKKPEVTHTEPDFPELPQVTEAPETKLPEPAQAAVVAAPKKQPKKEKKPKKSKQQDHQALLKSFLNAVKNRNILKPEELHAGLSQNNYRVSAKLFKSISKTILKSDVMNIDALFDVLASVSNVDTALIVGRGVFAELVKTMNLLEFTDILDDMKVDFCTFIESDENGVVEWLSGGDKDLSFVWSSPLILENVAIIVNESQTPYQDILNLISQSQNIGILVTRKICSFVFSTHFGNTPLPEFLSDESVALLNTTCSDDLPKQIMIQELINCWCLADKPKGLADIFEKCTECNLLSFDDVNEWRLSENNKTNATQSALMQLTDWFFEMDNRLTSRYSSDEDEDESEDETPHNEYVSDLLAERKHRSAADYEVVSFLPNQ